MKKIPVINGLRGIAILTVIAYHIWYPLVGAHTRQPLLSLNGTTILHKGFLQSGHLAVLLFFILSGFVLALPYASKHRTMERWGDAFWFYKNRALRLLPLYYVNLAILVAIHNSLPKDPVTLMRDIVLMGTATFHFVPSMWFPRYNGVLWSIGSELWFCIFMPAILWAIHRYGLLRIVAGITFLSLCIRFLGATLIGSGSNYLSNNVLGDAFFFVAGITAAYVHVRHRIRHSLLLCMTGIAMIAASFLLQEQLTMWYLTPALYPILTTLFGTGCAMLMLGLVHTKSKILMKIFGNRPLQLIGMMSYSLYVWHPSVIPMYMIQMTPLNLLRMAIMLFILCWLSYRYIEFGRVKSARDLLPEKATSYVAA